MLDLVLYDAFELKRGPLQKQGAKCSAFISVVVRGRDIEDRVV